MRDQPASNGTPNPGTKFLAFGVGMTDGQWTRRRFIPVVLAAGALGVLLGFAREALDMSVVGIQGMAVGGALGYLAARLGKTDPDLFWTFGQRLWFGLAVTLSFAASNVVATSLAHAGPIDTPLYWLTEVVNGLQREPFLSITRTGAATGALEGGWWIAFATLDAALLMFLFTAISVIGSGGGADAPAGFAASPSTSARSGALGVVVLLVLCAVLYAYPPGQRTVNPYSIQNLKKLQGLAGEWRLEDGAGVFANTDEELRFTLKVAGFNMLSGNSAGPGRYRLSLDDTGDIYRGMLVRGGDRSGRIPQYFRMRPSPDGSRLTMVFTVFGMGGRRDVTMTARRPAGWPGGTGSAETPGVTRQPTGR
jgi:hypothetical protein